MTQIKIPGVPDILEGSGPLVIIGPNGVGKTRLGAELARSNNAERVGALRSIEVSNIQMLPFQQAAGGAKNALAQTLQAPWQQAVELQALMSEILAEDRNAAVIYREEVIQHREIPKDSKLVDTRLRRIVSVWNRHFPGRSIKIDYSPTVVRQMTDGTSVEYSISQMSEGERTALYLAVRIVSCKSQILVIDEPETFFHPMLARNFWDDLENEASSIRFVYITHDLPFALSRKGARFAIARAENRAEVLPETAGIPTDVIAEVLGAATFSVSASRLIFCEGTSSSLDRRVLKAWHNCTSTAVVPVGSCNAVRDCVAVFNAGQITSGLSACGYIDRDDWPDYHLECTPQVKAHNVSEIEGFFCDEVVFLALAKYNSLKDPVDSFRKFINEAKSQFANATLNKAILQRAKLRVEVEQRSLLNSVTPHPKLDQVRHEFSKASPPGGWEEYLRSAFAIEEDRLKKSLEAGPADFVRDFPAKSFYKLAAKHLQLVEEKMIEAFCAALELTEEQSPADPRLAELRDTLVSRLEPILWPRKAH